VVHRGLHGACAYGSVLTSTHNVYWSKHVSCAVKLAHDTLGHGSAGCSSSCSCMEF
jgi:hypothetical protein